MMLSPNAQEFVPQQSSGNGGAASAIVAVSQAMQQPTTHLYQNHQLHQPPNLIPTPTQTLAAPAMTYYIVNDPTQMHHAIAASMSGAASPIVPSMSPYTPNAIFNNLSNYYYSPQLNTLMPKTNPMSNAPPQVAAAAAAAATTTPMAQQSVTNSTQQYSYYAGQDQSIPPSASSSSTSTQPQSATVQVPAPSHQIDQQTAYNMHAAYTMSAAAPHMYNYPYQMSPIVPAFSMQPPAPILNYAALQHNMSKDVPRGGSHNNKYANKSIHSPIVPHQQAALLPNMPPSMMMPPPPTAMHHQAFNAPRNNHPNSFNNNTRLNNTPNNNNNNMHKNLAKKQPFGPGGFNKNSNHLANNANANKAKSSDPSLKKKLTPLDDESSWPSLTNKPSNGKLLLLRLLKQFSN
jgi:hypothetical protein